MASPALSSLIGGGAIIEGPSGIVTDNGVPIGPTGPAGTHLGGIGLIGAKTLIAPAVTSVVASAPLIAAPAAIGLGGWGLGGVGLGGVGLGGVGLGGLGLGGLGLGKGVGLNAGLGVGLAGVGVGHGIGISGVSVQGPGTVPATIAGPSGKIVADGLWGPTLAGGNGGHGGW